MIKICALFTIIFFPLMAQASKAVIVVEKGIGRLGDNLLHVAEGVWLANKFQLPIYIEPFEYSNEFAFSTIFPKSKDPLIAKYARIKVMHANQIEILPKKPTAYYIQYATPYPNELRTKNVARAEDYDIDWREPQFLEQIKDLLKPINEVPLVQRPEGMPSIAVHVRAGGGFDKPHVIGIIPGKFTSTSWAIQKIHSIYADLNQPLYVHIFTDSLDPDGLLASMKDVTNNPNIHFGISKIEDKKTSILSDLFSMAEFDYLICSQSNFAFISWLIGNHIKTYRQCETRFIKNQLYVISEEVL